MKTRSNDLRLFASYEPPATDASADTAEHATHPDAGAATAVPRVSKALQMHAGGNLRKHMWRGVLRMGALLASDLGAFLVLRTALRGAREWAVFHGTHTDFIHWLFGDGALGGWQYAIALVVSLVVRGAYGSGDNRRDVSRLFSACALGTALPLWAALWSEPLLLTMGQYVLTMLPAFGAVVATRCAFDWLVMRHAPSAEARAVARTILVGHAGECITMLESRALSEQGMSSVIGYVDVNPASARGALGSLAELESILIVERADTVILCGMVDDAAFMRVTRAAIAAECRLLAVTRRLQVAGVRPNIVWWAGQPFMELRTIALRGHQLILKRAFDIVVSALLLALFAPLMAIIAIAVRLESRGPALFRQMRPGRGGRRFGMLKFRSMRPDAEAVLRADPELYATFLRNACKLPEEIDPRITRIGRFLRRTSLDELPQLWNVLLGDMSLVGPRPVVGPELESYGDGTPRLLSVRPGITGAWQVNGRSTVHFPERAYLELEYVERWSLLMDLGILVRTIPAVLARRGAH